VVFVRRVIVALLVLTGMGWTTLYFGPSLGLSDSTDAAHHLSYIFFALLTSLCVALVLVNWRILGASLRRIRGQLQQFENTDQIGMIMVDANNELADLVATINQYLSNVHLRSEQDRIQRKELELQADAAEAERRQTEAVICSISEAVLVTDRYNELLMANQGGQELFDFDMARCFRMPVDQVIQDGAVVEFIAQAQRDKSHQLVRLLERPHPTTGKPLSLSLRLSCVLDAQKQVAGVVLVARDITAEQEIARMKDDFVNSVSHELKTPLASIRAYAEMLADNEAENSESHRQFCEIIQEQADRLNRLIDNILNLSRIESGAMQVCKRPLNMVELLEDVVVTMQPQADDKDITIELHTARADLGIVADRDMIWQALLNLVSNAIKYSDRHQSIHIDAQPCEDTHLVVRVRDEGAGIPAHCLERIFEKFYRVDEHNDLAGGTGLGLHLVREIVQNIHQGRITVDSAPGRGTAFAIYLPMCASRHPVGAD